MDDEATRLLSRLELKEYEATALAGLLRLGRTTAPNLAEATEIPQARIYGVLDQLADLDYVKIVPGRPKEYIPRSPEQILERADENRYQKYREYSEQLDEMRDDFLSTLQPVYDQEGGLRTGELFYVVDVGEPSERETRELYSEAEHRIDVVTKSLEYLPEIESAFANVVDRDVDVRVLLLHPRHLSDNDREIQSEVVDRVRDEYPTVSMRYSEERLPLRGTLVDPSMDYESGMAIFLVEENNVPLNMRQAAVTENGSLVAGMMRYFDMIWDHGSVRSPDGDAVD